MPELTVYRAIDEYPAYRVGTDGSLWSRWKRVGAVGVLGSHSVLGDAWHQLKPTPRDDGYIRVTLYRDGVSVVRFLHRLVLEVFVGPAPDGLECRHLNGVRSDCRLENLCWGTREENAQDQVRHGTLYCGPRPWNARRSPEVVREIKRRLVAGQLQKIIAADLSIPPSIVSQIHQGKIWKHVMIECAEPGEE